MSAEATATFQITGWDEKTYADLGSGAKLTRTKASQTYQGGIEGEGTVEYLMAYAANGSASFVGIELIQGKVAGKVGSFVLRHIGAFEGGKARSAWTVIAGAGSGELAALRGEGTFVAAHGVPAEIVFRHDFAQDA